jgi:hypothetical protein
MSSKINIGNPAPAGFVYAKVVKKEVSAALNFLKKTLFFPKSEW